MLLKRSKCIEKYINPLIIEAINNYGFVNKKKLIKFFHYYNNSRKKMNEQQLIELENGKNILIDIICNTINGYGRLEYLKTIYKYTKYEVKTVKQLVYELNNFTEKHNYNNNLVVNKILKEYKRHNHKYDQNFEKLKKFKNNESYRHIIKINRTSKITNLDRYLYNNNEEEYTMSDIMRNNNSNDFRCVLYPNMNATEIRQAVSIILKNCNSKNIVFYIVVNNNLKIITIADSYYYTIMEIYNKIREIIYMCGKEQIKNNYDFEKINKQIIQEYFKENTILCLIVNNYDMIKDISRNIDRIIYWNLRSNSSFPILFAKKIIINGYSKYLLDYVNLCISEGINKLKNVFDAYSLIKTLNDSKKNYFNEIEIMN